LVWSLSYHHALGSSGLLGFRIPAFQPRPFMTSVKALT
jgi:hypothetical protein